ncbi:MAG: hypothetical protein ABI683_09405 [Ginsengibacter sp.]
MSDKAKIHLSKFETELVTNAEWILTKQAIINKVHTFFGEMHDIYKRIASRENKVLKELGLVKNGKISKGENYLGLPYLILDYPASFHKDSILAIRTMFWWGNFFSITLHISGEKILSGFDLQNIRSRLAGQDYAICVNNDQWQHTYEKENYTPLKGMNEKDFDSIIKKSFIKISKNIELSRWHEAPGFLENSYKELIDFLRISYRGDETIL